MSSAAIEESQIAKLRSQVAYLEMTNAQLRAMYSAVYSAFAEQKKQHQVALTHLLRTMESTRYYCQEQLAQTEQTGKGFEDNGGQTEDLDTSRQTLEPEQTEASQPAIEAQASE